MVTKNLVPLLKLTYYISLELYETLKDIYEFYLPLTDKKESLLPEPRQIKARRGTSSVRPEFPIVYDEE